MRISDWSSDVCSSDLQCAAFALAKDPRFAGRLAAADASMAGYHWYDRLTRISGLRFTFDQDGSVHIFDSETLDAPESGFVENLNLLVEVSNATAETIDRKRTRQNSSH